MNGQTYNEERPDEPNFDSIREWESKLVGSGEMIWKFGGTSMLPSTLTEYFEIYAYLGISADLEFILGEKFGKINSVQVEKSREKTKKVQFVGGFKGGATGKLKVPDVITGTADANLKAELEFGYNAPTYKFQINAKPLVLNFSAKVTMSSLDITLLQYNYIKNLTNEQVLYEYEYQFK